jgi:hypothetical protein
MSLALQTPEQVAGIAIAGARAATPPQRIARWRSVGWIPVAWRSFSGRCPLQDRGRWACGSSARVQIPAHPGPHYDCGRYAEADD